MKEQYSNNAFQDDRSELMEALRDLDPRLRFAIGLTLCAVIAYYVPAVLIALTGVWVNNLTMIIPLLIAVIILATQNLIGNRLNKLFLVGVFFAVIINCLDAYFLARISPWPAWHSDWMVFFLPTMACILNAWLLMKFKVAAHLA